MATINRRQFFARSAIAAAAVGATAQAAPFSQAHAAKGKQPNILFAIADDWSWPHAGAYGAPQINTPNFDRVAKEGCLFNNCHTAAPQCSPNRAATLTGRHIWQIEEAGTHASIFPNTWPVFTDCLEDTGYHIGYTGKPWSPGDWRRGGWERNPAGPGYNSRKLEPPYDGMKNLDYAANFEDFLGERPEGAPFMFWFGTSEPHRRYEKGSGLKEGKDPAKVNVPPFLPDAPTVREDLLDYFVEVEWFDTHLGRILAKLEEIGELDNTLVVATSDNGMPFPRAKANLYEYGTHVPLAVRWPEKVAAGQTMDTLVGFIDLGPTFLDAAGAKTPPTMTGKSFLPILTGAADPGARGRDFLLTGRERHTHARYDNLGYPVRAIRTADYLYIHNFKPDRWPAGPAPGFHDIDGSPTLDYLMENREKHPNLYDLTLMKRPAEELYAVGDDPGCMKNLAADPAHADTLLELRAKLMGALHATNDPRVLGTGDIFESYPRVSHMRPYLGGFSEQGEYNLEYVPPGLKSNTY
ncbi:MAG: sulfatase [Candidatus Hydrogenedentota bacterium]